MPHLVLGGVGHGQLDLLASLVRSVPAGWQVTVVTSQPAFHYSGLLPAIIAGREAPDAASIPVAAIAARAGFGVRIARIVALDAVARTLLLDDGETVPYDLLSLDVGSVPAALDVPGVAAHAFAMRPFSAALGLAARLDAVLDAAAPGAPVPATVVGAGAAGVEIAFAVRARIHARGGLPAVTLIDPSLRHGAPLAGFPDAARTRAAHALQQRGIVTLGGSVREVTPEAVVVQGAQGLVTLPSVATAWVTGPAAAPWLADAGLTCDARGYPLADETLALTADASLFGAGDCVTLRHAPETPKAGVYAVRMAPILAANVRARLEGRQATARYVPQHHFLALLSTGDGRALLRWRGWSLESRWAQHLKQWIDERYLRRYQTLTH